MNFTSIICTIKLSFKIYVTFGRNMLQIGFRKLSNFMKWTNYHIQTWSSYLQVLDQFNRNTMGFEFQMKYGCHVGPVASGKWNNSMLSITIVMVCFSYRIHVQFFFSLSQYMTLVANVLSWAVRHCYFLFFLARITSKNADFQGINIVQHCR